MKNPLLVAIVLFGTLAAPVITRAAVLGSISAPGASDLFLGVEDSSGTITKNLVVDLGNASTITTLQTTSLSADLTTVFGSGYSANSSLVYGVFGISGSTPIYSQASTGVFGSGSDGQTAQNREFSYNSQATALGNFKSEVAGAASASITGGGVTTVGVYMSANDANSWTSFASGSKSVFGNANWGGLETSLGSALDMYNSPTGSESLNGNYLNYQINLSTAGSLSVIAAAVPEPSSYALVGLGALLLIMAYRRGTVAKI